MASIAAHQLTDAVCEHGEGPAWSDRWAGPRFVDMLRGDVLELAANGSVARRHVGSVAALTRARRRGGWIALTRHAVLFADSDSLDAPLTEGPRLWADPTVRANEGGCDPAGALHAGSMAWDASPGRGSLMRMDPMGLVTEELADLTISNGLAWTAEGSRAFYVDSATGTIDVFDWTAKDGLSSRRTWAHVEGGGADGLALDTDGGVWVAIFGAGAVHRYDRQGRLADVVELPIRQPTALAFTGAHRERLIVTTSRHGLADPELSAGAVYELVGHGVRGVPTYDFGG